MMSSVLQLIQVTKRCRFFHNNIIIIIQDDIYSAVYSAPAICESACSSFAPEALQFTPVVKPFLVSSSRDVCPPTGLVNDGILPLTEKGAIDCACAGHISVAAGFFQQDLGF